MFGRRCGPRESVQDWTLDPELQETSTTCWSTMLANPKCIHSSDNSHLSLFGQLAGGKTDKRSIYDWEFVSFNPSDLWPRAKTANVAMHSGWEMMAYSSDTSQFISACEIQLAGFTFSKESFISLYPPWLVVVLWYIWVIWWVGIDRLSPPSHVKQ